MKRTLKETKESKTILNKTLKFSNTTGGIVIPPALFIVIEIITKVQSLFQPEGLPEYRLSIP